MLKFIETYTNSWRDGKPKVPPMKDLLPSAISGGVGRGVKHVVNVLTLGVCEALDNKTKIMLAAMQGGLSADQQNLDHPDSP